MSFTGNEDHSISLSAAAELTENFRTSNPGDIKGFFYGKTAIQAILNQVGCVGIRIYFGETDGGDPKLVIVGVESNEDDLENGYLAEFGISCPSNCGSSNDLNS